jgi:hypothetical protein
MSTKNAYIGVVIVLIIIVIAYCGWRYWRGKRSRDHFSLATPATPRVREAVGDLFVSLKAMSDLGATFDQLASTPEASARPDISSARVGVATLTRTLNQFEKRLSGSPPTYVNYLAIYRGLSSTDRTLLDASDAYTSLGQGIQQKEDTLLAAQLGGTLIDVGRQLRRVVAGVHRLGVALDVE